LLGPARSFWTRLHFKSYANWCRRRNIGNYRLFADSTVLWSALV